MGGATPFEDRYIKLENQWFKIIDKDDETLFKKINYNHDAFYLLVNILMTRTITNRVCFNRQSITRVFMRNTKEYIKEPHISKAQKALNILVDSRILIPDENIDSFEFKTDNIIHADVNLEFLEQDNNFFRLFHSQLIEINECSNVDRAKLLSVYCSIRSHIFEDCAGYRVVENLVNDTGLVKNTIKKYLDTLVKLELLIYKNPGTRYSESTKKYKEAPNFFTYPSVDADKLLKDAISDYMIIQKSKGYILINDKETKTLMNERRSNTSKRKYYDNQFKEDKIDQEKYKKIIQECDKKTIDLLPYEAKKSIEAEEMKEQCHSSGDNNGWGTRQNIPGIDEEFLVDDEELMDLEVDYQADLENDDPAIQNGQLNQQTHEEEKPQKMVCDKGQEVPYHELFRTDNLRKERLERLKSKETTKTPTQNSSEGATNNEEDLDYFCFECDTRLTNLEFKDEKISQGYCEKCKETRIAWLDEVVNKNGKPSYYDVPQKNKQYDDYYNDEDYKLPF